MHFYILERLCIFQCFCGHYCSLYGLLSLDFAVYKLKEYDIRSSKENFRNSKKCRVQQQESSNFRFLRFHTQRSKERIYKLQGDNKNLQITH